MDGMLTSKKIFPLLSSIIAAIIGSLVLWGWHTHNVTLIQLTPQLTGMHYNVALCFFGAGIALVAICNNYRVLPSLFGVLILSVGYLTLAEYLCDINFGLDQFFMRATLTPKELSPYCMSPSGALALGLIGTSIFFLSNYVNFKFDPKNLLFVLMILSLMTLTIGFIAIMGYITDLPDTSGWGNSTRMAIHTAVGIVFLSISLISIIWIKASEHNFSFAPWVPWFIFMVTQVITLSFWQASSAYIERNERQQNTIASESIKSIIKDELEYRTRALSRMASRWQSRIGGTPLKEWSQDALRYIADQPGYQSIEWADSKFFVRWIAPLKGNEAALNINLMKEDSRAPALLAAMKSGETIITPILTLKSGQKGFLIYAPIGRTQNFQGVIIGAINAKLFFDEIFNDAVTDYNIAIYHQKELIYQRYPNQEKTSARNSVPYMIKDLGWSITAWPVLELATKQHTWLPTVILFIGFIIALMLSLISHLAQIAKKNAIKAQEEIKTRQKTEQQLMVYSRKLKKLSLVDPLTGVDNRRSLSNILQAELAQLKDSEMSLSIILLDVDYFKKINDTYGHVTGDNVLQKVGNILRKNTRSTDTVARYGGEEFCVVLRNTPDRQAFVIAEKLRLLIADQIFLSEKKAPFHVTCSFGVYQVPQKAKKITQVFEVVDGALYTAKHSGRNCVVLV